ncbi:hypothetical protein [Microtetraspora malaysiensis]|uniref:hypothetical protein n=1 Tax=Microtetraspora malaysiensis TaxID=161358 RepID=UPI000833E00D|nr:hypothetical protein [Microtetraspora malaysiensis]
MSDHADTTPLPVLTRMGLPADADLVFRTLLMFGPATVRVLYSCLRVSRDRVETALAILDDAEVAMPVAVPGKATPWWAGRPPEQAITRLRERRTKGQMPPSVALGGRVAQAGLSLHGVRPLRGQALVDRVRSLHDAVREEFLYCSTEMSFSEEEAASLREFVPRARRQRARGVRRRSLSLSESLPPALPEDELALFDGEMRTADMLPVEIGIYDRQVVLMVPADDPHCRLEVTEPLLVAGIHALFEQHWSSSTQAVTLSLRQQALVTLLAAGHTDTGMAARLGISARTVAYEVRALMDAHGVCSRFQLGVMLSRTLGDLNALASSSAG